MGEDLQKVALFKNSAYSFPMFRQITISVLDSFSSLLLGLLLPLFLLR
jgi:hypothetical protein